MVRSKTPSGFTLIEVTIVMSISAALIVIAFVGQAQLRAKFSFSSGLEQTKSFLLQVQSEANTTVNTTAGAGTGGKTFFAKAIMFDKSAGNNTSLNVYTLLKDAAGTITIQSPSPEYTKTVPNGLMITKLEHPVLPTPTVRAKSCMIYAKIDSSSQPAGYIIDGCTVANLVTSVYSTPVITDLLKVTLQDVDDRNDGWITIKPFDFTIESMVTK